MNAARRPQKPKPEAEEKSEQDDSDEGQRIMLDGKNRTVEFNIRGRDGHILAKAAVCLIIAVSFLTACIGVSLLFRTLDISLSDFIGVVFLWLLLTLVGLACGQWSQ